MLASPAAAGRRLVAPLALLVALLLVLLAPPAVAAPTPTDDPPPDPPALTALTAPVVDGDPAYGQTLAVTPPTWSQPGVQTSYQWLRDRDDIDGATAAAYQVSAADGGALLAVRATGTAAGQSVVSTSDWVLVSRLDATLDLEVNAPSPLRLVVQVNAAAPETPDPGGTVDLWAGSEQIASRIRLVDGQLRRTFDGLPSGDTLVQAVYSGTEQVNGAQTERRLAILPDTPTLAVSTSSPAVGRARVTVRVGASHAATPTGRVSLSERGRTLGTTTLSGGRARWDRSGLTPGRHTFRVSYAGSSYLDPGRRDVAVTVKAKARSTVRLKASSPSAKKVRVVATVSAAGHPDLGGTVEVKEGSRVAKSSVAVRDGVATWSAGGVKPGKHTYTVRYRGTSQVAASSATVTVTAKKPKARPKPADPKPGGPVREFQNCTELNSSYPHGVGRRGARDQTSGGSAPVTDFYVSDELYRLNTKSDRDKDGVACEKH